MILMQFVGSIQLFLDYLWAVSDHNDLQYCLRTQ